MLKLYDSVEGKWIVYDLTSDEGIFDLKARINAAVWGEDLAWLVAAMHALSTEVEQTFGRERGEIFQAFFNYVNERLWPLVLRAVTKIVYLSLRDGFESKKVQLLHHNLVHLMPMFAKCTFKMYSDFIVHHETETGEYYGEDISDDSDSELSDDEDESDSSSDEESIGSDFENDEPSDFPKLQRRLFADVKSRDDYLPRLDVVFGSSKVKVDSRMDIGSTLKSTCRITRGGVHPTGRIVRSLMPTSCNSPLEPVVDKGRQRWVVRKQWGRGIHDNSRIYHPAPDISKRVLADIQILNQAVHAGKTDVDNLTATKFCLAQYRGIAYNLLSFDSEGRRSSRQNQELRLPVLASAVFDACNISPAAYYSKAISQEQFSSLMDEARRLQQVLVEKRFTRSIRIGRTTYDNFAYALQKEYTSDYDAFFTSLQAYVAAKHKHLETSPVHKEQLRSRGVRCALWPLFDGLVSAKNPFVSTGNTPRHALRYAYGIKYYEHPNNLHKNTRLRPRWRKNGRAERPYSGKVYISLHNPSEYLHEGPLDVVTLHMNEKMTIFSQIIPERESSFPAFLPMDRVVGEHVAKYPSFNHGYHDVFDHKYGLTRKAFDVFANAITTSAPHSAERKATKQALGEWLVRYHEARLIEMARRIAKKQGRVLLMRDRNGFFGLEPPPYRTSKKVSKSQCSGPLVTSTTFNSLCVRQNESLLVKRKRSEVPSWLKYEPELSFSNLLEASRHQARFAAAIRSDFDIYQVPGDGNCLFRAIIEFCKKADENVGDDTLMEKLAALCTVVRTQVTHATLRRATVARMRLQGALSNEYLDEMQDPADNALQAERWGGDAEISALAAALDVTVKVYSPQEESGVALFNPGKLHTIVLYHAGGNHWDAVIPKNVNTLNRHPYP